MFLLRIRAFTRLRARHRLSAEHGRAVVTAGVRNVFDRVVERRRRNDDSATLRAADFLDLVDRHVQLGSSLRGAVVKAAAETDHCPEELRVVLLHCKAGAPLDDAEVLSDASSRSNDEAFLIRTIVVAGAGGPAASFALQRGAWSLRERHAIRMERRTHASQAMFSARILSWLPVAFGAIMAVTNGSVRAVYFGGIGGLACLAAGLGLNFAGRRWMRSITCSFA